ncbi:hypothetical protein ACFLWC_04530 [Chloroflexota bacterium]
MRGARQNPVAAKSVEDYFSISYEVELSKTEIQGNEVFYATVEGTATCNNKLPVTPSEAKITSRIVAQHQTSGAKVTLNSSYTVTINPFPSQIGETVQDTQVVPLQFPVGSQPGSYNVAGEPIEAKVNTFLGWVNVTSYLPSSQTVGSVTYTSDDTDDGGDGGGGNGGGGGGATTPPEPSLPPGTSDISGFVSADGIFTETFQAESPDDKSKLTIDKGTKGLTREGSPLTQIAITEMEEPPAPPENSSIIGLTYDLGPDGATFDPPTSLTFTYDEDLIPEGVAEENLVIATCDKEASNWVVLHGSTVDPEANTITAPVPHFTAFSILAYTRPAAFIVSRLSITPEQIGIREKVTISTLVINNGDLTGNYEVVLKIDDVVIARKGMTLVGGGTEKIAFATSQDTTGTYVVNVNGLSGTFTVKPAASPPPPLPPTPAVFNTNALTISPDSVDIGEEVTITVLITNTGNLTGNYEVVLKINNVTAATKELTIEGGGDERVTFTTIQDTAGTYSIDVNGLLGTFAVKPAAPLTPHKPAINWWLVGGIITSYIILVVIIALVVRHQKA